LRNLATKSHQVVIVAAVVGAVTGLFVAGFERFVIDIAYDHIVRLRPWEIAILPGIGLIVAVVSRRMISPGTDAGTSDEYLHAFHDRHHELGWRPFVARTVAALATLGSGVPMGLEGPSMYAGAVVGSNVQRRLPRTFRDADRRVLLVAGAAAGVAAIFKAPATGAVFAIEVPYQGDLARRMLLPALVASATGYLAFVAINGTAALFPIDGTPSFSIRDLLGAMGVGVVAGAVARVFGWLLRHAKRLSSNRRPILMTLGAGAALSAAFTIARLMTGRSLLIGPGYDVVVWASDPKRSVGIIFAILCLRCFATATAVAGGATGGLFVPLVVAGALTGAIIGRAVNGDLTLFIVIGVAACLGAGYRVPLAAVVFVAETTGRPSFIVPGLLAAVAAELMMGASSVTKLQQSAELQREDASAQRLGPQRSDESELPSP
jgi:CIC family chloride channel protein